PTNTRYTNYRYTLSFNSYRDNQDLHSFPTRRSSDLQGAVSTDARNIVPDPGVVLYRFTGAMVVNPIGGGGKGPNPNCKATLKGRSEEHTSELQSRFDLVCRLLLEKKNKIYIL